MYALLLAALTSVLWVSLQTPACASCSAPAAPSPAVFRGLVLSTTSKGRIATVRSDAGPTVTVVGTPASSSQGTSVDRIFEVGGRYEFHPYNDSSPFEDNACSATRLLSMEAVPRDQVPARRPWARTATVAALMLVVVGLGFTVLRRRRF